MNKTCTKSDKQNLNKQQTNINYNRDMMNTISKKKKCLHKQRTNINYNQDAKNTINKKSHSLETSYYTYLRKYESYSYNR